MLVICHLKKKRKRKNDNKMEKTKVGICNLPHPNVQGAAGSMGQPLVWVYLYFVIWHVQNFLVRNRPTVEGQSLWGYGVTKTQLSVQTRLKF